MFIFYVLCFFSLYICFYIYRKETSENFDSNSKAQKYSRKSAMIALESFIRQLNTDRNDQYTIYSVERIKRLNNKLFIKCFAQNTHKKFVRQFFIEFKLSFINDIPVLTFYSEHGNGKQITNGTEKITDSASFAKYTNFKYSPIKVNFANTEMKNLSDFSFFNSEFISKNIGKF